MDRNIGQQLKVLGFFKGLCDVYAKTDARFDTCRDMVKKALEGIIGISTKIKEKEWFDKDCRKAIELDIQ